MNAIKHKNKLATANRSKPGSVVLKEKLRQVSKKLSKIVKEEKMKYIEDTGRERSKKDLEKFK